MSSLNLEHAALETVARERALAALSAGFGALGLLLAGLGLYGVVAHHVVQRRKEIAVRVALGATPDAVKRLVLTPVALVTAGGLIAGGLTVLGAHRAAESLVFGITPADSHVLAGVALMLAAVLFGSATLPALRAARVDPAAILRE